MRISFVVIVCWVAVLVGCSSKIDAVKNSPSLTQNYTVGQVLDNNPSCADTKWSVMTDPNGRQIVEYSCELKLDPEQKNNFYSSQRDWLNNRVKMWANNYSYARTSLEETMAKTNESGAPSEYQISMQPILEQVVSFEDTFKSAVQKFEAADIKLIEEASKKKYKLEQKIQFLVSDKNVSRIGYKFLIDDQQIPFRQDMNYVAKLKESPTGKDMIMKIIGDLGKDLETLMESPTGKDMMMIYWSSNLPAPDLNMSNFPYSCDPNKGCIEFKR